MAAGCMSRSRIVHLLACNLERGLSSNHPFEDGVLELAGHLSPFSIDKRLPLTIVQLRPRGIIVRNLVKYSRALRGLARRPRQPPTG